MVDADFMESSPIGRRVDIRIVTFEACSSFTRVTARRIAQPPKGDLCREAPTQPVTQPSRSPASGLNRQLSRWNPPPLMIRAVKAHCQVRTLYGAIFVKGVPQGSYPFLRPSVSLFDLGSPFLRSLIATQKAITKLSVSRDFFFTSHFPSSTAPQAFPRPDRGDAHAVERKVASRMGALAPTE